MLGVTLENWLHKLPWWIKNNILPGQFPLSDFEGSLWAPPQSLTWELFTSSYSNKKQETSFSISCLKDYSIDGKEMYLCLRSEITVKTWLSAMSFTSSLAEGVIFFEKVFFYYSGLAVLQCQRGISVNILNATYW